MSSPSSPPIKPLISVLMPIYNAAKYVEDAIQSIFDQTLKDFEIIAIDDGSTDGSGEILDKLALQDSRLRVWHQRNQGIVSALNFGLGECRGEFIARMDADDISLPNRFEVQHSYLVEHPEIDACASFQEMFSSTGSTWPRIETEDDRIRANLLFNTSFPHPNAFFRASFFLGDLKYRDGYLHAEDFNLWSRASETKRFHTIPTVLYRYRRHEQQVTTEQGDIGVVSSGKIRSEVLKRFKFDSVSPREYEIHEAISTHVAAASLPILAEYGRWLLKLRDTNRVQKILPVQGLDEVLTERWFQFCRQCSGWGFSVWKTYLQGPSQAIGKVERIDQMKLFVRCLIRKV